MTKIKSHFRKIFESMPATITVPVELRNQRVEVLLLPLEAESSQENRSGDDELDWPDGFIERTAGKWAGTPIDP